ncbi:MAG: 6,7-dimethyl-8-ribityllumazine synthase [Steroidobacteraceae bacterium]|nr:6,7-dimethyl-8-ribityllumazine synthase [Nevskiaceae bacterium]MCP5339539.1 6,7-dimethyl-8-ribityllumazine synthase [Nevskiaceae bacterium]MCP5359169.1 6,7-dimethyl-8-ribityllumazine synthase [Nevskiaceae bacterium]MCP5466403.1 6,7-dimethyl-8-ribityllumazine synthase [Nevskiaceae bacterium]MCP5471896.1 6,7-dimethyl-8-ribityllumazine synthase [Nevskiaceae bacterium]
MTEVPALAQIEGRLDARGLKVAIVAGRWNDFIIASLLRGAQAAWSRHGGAAGDLAVARVPGAFELPVAVKRFAASGRYHAVVAFGCVIRGDTPHFDYVAGEAAAGLMRAQLDSGVPCIFGVLTVDTVEQALERAATSRMNKGGEAMDVAIEMADLFRRVGA